MEHRQFYRFLKVSNSYQIKPLVFLSLKPELRARMDRELRDHEIAALLQKRQAGASHNQISQALDNCVESQYQTHVALMRRLENIQQTQYPSTVSTAWDLTPTTSPSPTPEYDPELGVLVKRIYIMTIIPLFHGLNDYVCVNQPITITWEYWSKVLGLRMTIHYSTIQPNLPDQYQWTCCNLKSSSHPLGRCSAKLPLKLF